VSASPAVFRACLLSVGVDGPGELRMARGRVARLPHTPVEVCAQKRAACTVAVVVAVWMPVNHVAHPHHVVARSDLALFVKISVPNL